jgi:hypothetical protein
MICTCITFKGFHRSNDLIVDDIEAFAPPSHIIFATISPDSVADKLGEQIHYLAQSLGKFKDAVNASISSYYIADYAHFGGGMQVVGDSSAAWN